MGNAYVYIDGFNFYYGVVKNTAYKWLDVHALMSRLLPNHTVQKIIYATAPTRALPWDQGAPKRQSSYLKAIELLPTVEVIKGSYSQQTTKMPMLNPAATDKVCGPTDYPRVTVLKNEEKGTDVTIGARMVLDACTSTPDVIVVVSNDSDLFEPVRIVRDLGIPVIQVVPTRPSNGKYQGRRSVYVGRVDKIVHEINESVLRACQMPNPLVCGSKSITKPASW